MNSGLLNGLFDFLAQIKDFVSFFSEVLSMMPSIFLTILTISFIVIIIVGTFWLIFKLIG